jgi:hypothetical protein
MSKNPRIHVTRGVQYSDYTTLHIWNQGAHAGTLTVLTEDANYVVSLLTIESEPALSRDESLETGEDSQSTITTPEERPS